MRSSSKSLRAVETPASEKSFINLNTQFTNFSRQRYKYTVGGMDYYGKTFGRFDYRILMFIVPIVGLLLLPMALNVPLGIDFTGGTEIQILTDKQLTVQGIDGAFGQCVQDLRTSVQDVEGKTAVIIRSKGDISGDCIDSSLTQLGFPQEEISKIVPSTFRPELGRTLLDRGAQVFMIAVILMIIIVFIAFRTVIPSIAVISAALFDILIALGLLSILGVEMTLAGVAALMMLIGYSVDTDIMLTSRTLKQAGKTFEQSVNEAFTTGITMTGTTFAAMLSIVIVTEFFQMAALQQIGIVILCGLIADVGTTWLTNVGILNWYVKRSKGRAGKSRFKFSLFRS